VSRVPPRPPLPICYLPHLSASALLLLLPSTIAKRQCAGAAGQLVSFQSLPTCCQHEIAIANAKREADLQAHRTRACAYRH
jgi:hypothetical protein